VLRSLSIRNFVVVEALDVDFDAGFTVLTGETGAGKSILLDALGLLLGDRFEQRQVRTGAERAELSATFDVAAHAPVTRWLADAELDAGDELLLRRVQDAQGRSRTWINGRAATLAQLTAVGSLLLDLHGQHAHEALTSAESQRQLLDAFGGHPDVVRDVGDAWRAWRAAVARRDDAERSAQATAAERDALADRHRELEARAVGAAEWADLTAAQRRLANAADLVDATTQSESALTEGDDALSTRLLHVVNRLRQASAADPALGDVVALLEPAAIQVDEASRALRDYRRRLDVDSDELTRVEQRLSAIHDVARKHRVKPEDLHSVAQTIARRLGELGESDAGSLARAADDARQVYDARAAALTQRRNAAATLLAQRVTSAMQELSMAGRRFDLALDRLNEPASFGHESVAFMIATHPKQAAGPLSRVASGGELARVALAIQVAASEVGDIPTLVFDEVDTGIGGTVAATVGRMLQALAVDRQILCVTHLPQVAAHADHHFRVVKADDHPQATSALERLSTTERVDELARMLAGTAITPKTRAHARELYESHRRDARR
jgi:DNA repair protein RecN (Recombination protein N)